MVKRSYKFKLYESKKNKHLDEQRRIACYIYNRSIALHRRYYRRYGKYLHKFHLQKHIAKKAHYLKYNFWKKLGSQAVQNIAERIDHGFQRFFNKKAKRPPTFKKMVNYKSFTLKSSGWELLEDKKLRINKKIYKFFQSREISGKICTLTIKKDNLGDWYISFSLEQTQYETDLQTRTGNSVGLDFGLITYLTCSNGKKKQSPLFFKSMHTEISEAHRRVSLKEKGSNNRKKAKLDLNRTYQKLFNLRDDFAWKLARSLLKKYDAVFIEDLNMDGMKRLWGKKVSDLSFSSFVKKLEYLAKINNKFVGKIDRFYPSTKTCYECGHVKKEMGLKERVYNCGECGMVESRDLNAALNIYKVGASTFSEVLRSLGLNTSIECG